MVTQQEISEKILQEREFKKQLKTKSYKAIKQAEYRAKLKKNNPEKYRAMLRKWDDAKRAKRPADWFDTRTLCKYPYPTKEEVIKEFREFGLLSKIAELRNIPKDTFRHYIKGKYGFTAKKLREIIMD